ncbi:4-hydroxy-tetrahydrodipicolinate synthase [Paenibacillus sp. J5C2022]|uniref:4-hydroxy-tetrahydrodipicolinate synthase n=1 Tax=Paenibacillus sp. J5C2022 TaxID=2977129 RepID=UPI0021D00D71|nr:4-hydroxy-tetrahydrodipicolinate synthase [Paenibacillus sp. J5C2022]
MLQPSGIIAALVTPFSSDHKLNEGAARQMVNRLIAAGIDGLFCLGTNGEFFAMTSEEKIRLTRIVVEEAAGRVPVYAGSGGIATHEVIELSKRLEQTGVDALSIITPYFNPLTQEEVVEHFEAVAAAIPLPILLYNIPGRTNLNLAPESVAQLSAVPNIVGIKDSSGNLEQMIRYRALTDASFSVLAGSDSLILWNLMAGGNGAVAATANVVPKLVVSIYRHWLAGQFVQARDAQYSLQKLRAVNQKSSLPSVFKEAMRMIGIDAGVPRPPVRPLSEQARQELQAVLQQYGAEGVL